MQTSIATLSDSHAVAALAAFARAHQAPDQVTALDGDLRAALVAAFPDASAASPATAGDAARAALTLLAEDQEHGPAIRALAQNPVAQRYDIETAGFVVTAVLLALQTHVRIHRDPKGKVDVLVEKKPTDLRLLKELVRKLLGLAGE